MISGFLNEILPDEIIKEKHLYGVRSFMFGIYNKLYKEFERIENCELNNYIPTCEESYFYDNFYYLRKIFSEMFMGFDCRVLMPCVKRGHYQIPVSFIDAYSAVKNKELDENHLKQFADKRKYSTEESDRFIDFLKCSAIICIYERLNEDKSASEYFDILNTIADLPSEEIAESLSYAHALLKDEKTYLNSDKTTRYKYRAMLEKESKNKSLDASMLFKSSPDFFDKITRKLNYKAKYDLRSGIYFIFLYLLTVLPVISLCYISGNAFPLILILPMYYFAKEIVSSIFLRIIKPEYMPRYKPEYVKNIPTLLVMPVLLKENTEKEIYTKLEKAFLRNADSNIYFGVLCDYCESDSKHNTNDGKLSICVEKTINELNEKYGNIFFAFVRERSYSETQKKYIGRERKRGAITDLFNYITTGENKFLKSFGNIIDLRNCRYATVIDFDTEVTAESITELVSVICHPANKKYGIIVPRLSNITDKSKSTLYNEIISEYSGIDGYAHPIGNLIHELNGNGIFSGKGIIDINEYMNRAADLPFERILSHDFIEGALLNVGIASDIVFYEEQPMTFSSYEKRAHRWVRGDWQSTIMLFSHKLGNFDKYVLIDNLAESLSGISYIIALILSSFVSPVLLAAALLIMIMRIDYPLRTELYNRILTGIDSAMSVKCYSGVFAPLKIKIYNILLHLIEIPYCAVNNLDAICKALYRQYISKYNLLEWTASFDCNGALSGVKEYILPEILSVITFFVSLFCGIFYNNYLYILTALLSVVWVITPVILEYISQRKYLYNNINLDENREVLFSYAYDMWNFYSDNLTEEYNYLIPDNIQLDPPIGTALRTSPTNIGFSVLAVADAYAIGIISKNESERLICKILDTVESLAKYKGHLYNWYDITTKKPLSPAYISFVDSGNFSVCLLTASGIITDSKLKSRLISAAITADFSFLFDRNKLLFHIGYDFTHHKLSKNYYDILASESRLSVFLQIANGQIPYTAWQSMSRIPVKDKRHYGLCSWSGTAFEFFMPEIFLKTSKGSMLNEALYYAVYAQKKRSKDKPFGISESCFYSFSNDFAYQYKAMGVQMIGLRNRLYKDFTVSPYSSFLMMDIAFNDTLNNLEKLKKENMTGQYGFYEAIDYKAGSKPVKCYMAHHIGMSFTMLSNILDDDVNRKSFESFPGVHAYKYLLDEAIQPFAVRNRKSMQFTTKKASKTELFNTADINNPQAMVYSNGKYSLLISDNGIGYSSFCDFAITKFRKNMLDFPNGVFLIAEIDGVTVPLNFPKDNNDSISVCIKNDRMIYRCISGSMEIEIIAAVLNYFNCEIRKITLKNSSKKDVEINLYAYFEPVLSYKNAEERHPAYNALMIEAEKATSESAVIFTKRDDKGKNISICCGFADCKSEFETVKDRLFPLGKDITTVDMNELSLNGISKACINPVFCQKTKVTVNKNRKKEIEFIIAAGNSSENAEKEYKLSKDSFSNFAAVNINDISINLIPKLFYNGALCKCDKFHAVNRSALWKYGISCDKSILVVFCNNKIDITPYIELYVLLKKAGMGFDLVFISDDADYDKPLSNAISTALINFGIEEGINEGVFIVSPQDGDACSFLENTAEIVLFGNKERENDYLKRKVSISPKPKIKSGFITNGYFVGDDANKAPYCNILANKSFGTILSQNSLGFTFAFNSGLYKITRWGNDPVYDNRCEMLYLKIQDVYYDIIKSSVVEYTENFAEYHTLINGISITVKVSVSKNINAKVIEISAENDSTDNISIIYSIDPLLTENMNDSISHVGYTIDDKTAYFNNPVDLSYPQACGYIRGSKKSTISVNNGRMEISEKVNIGKNNIRYILGCEKDFESAKLNVNIEPINCDYSCPFSISTNNKAFDDFTNTFLYKQIVDSRLHARAGFYQVSGAYGFRDQLQDAICISVLDCNILKNQILRSCRHQFAEGDVMHWWHEITDDISTHKGVRTRCSDDLLWLPYAVAEYVKKTGDFEFLNIKIHYLSAVELSDNESDRYMECVESEISESIYLHCIKAFLRAYKTGSHNLILIGTGDWNDGLSNVGAKGRGESVWLSMFYIYVYNEFEFILKQMNDIDYINELRNYKDLLTSAIELNGWDGKYYLHGYYDNGSPLGSADNNECKIDIIPQIFASLSNSLDKFRCKKALESVEKYLVDYENRIIKLMDIPFTNGKQNPGYIKNYVAGVRENGGQYTHAAAFYAYTLFKINEPDKGFEILSLLNPSLRNDMEIYRNEPYVLSGDIYTAEGFIGRGGWSWYTGSAGWYLRTVIEEMLGVHLIDGNITITPKLPSFMDNLSFKINVNGTMLDIEMKRHGKNVLIENGAEIPYIKSDGAKHKITVLF